MSYVSILFFMYFHFNSDFNSENCYYFLNKNCNFNVPFVEGEIQRNRSKKLRVEYIIIDKELFMNNEMLNHRCIKAIILTIYKY